ncbi:universal stress protein [Streptomyces sp. cg36]|uniref:universal stress protein n=1 Tax=Streptomyces sp. cg36 TaxID=3238798 RepID=UPI0034E2F01E
MPFETVTRIERVVVGVDGSEASRAALRQAAAEARCHGAELCPVIAWTPPGGEAAHARYRPPEDIILRWTRAARAELDTTCERVLGREPQGLHVTPRVIRGRTEDVLVAVAARETDVLVMGAGSHGRVHRFLFGSASRSSLKRARCPVLVVHPDHEAGGAGAGGRAPRPRGVTAWHRGIASAAR